MAEFDAAICVDAMENVFPEDWPTASLELRRAVRDGGHLYPTVERIDQQKLIRSLRRRHRRRPAGAARRNQPRRRLPSPPQHRTGGGVGERRGPAGWSGSNERRHWGYSYTSTADPSQLVTGATGRPDHLCPRGCTPPAAWTDAGMWLAGWGQLFAAARNWAVRCQHPPRPVVRLEAGRMTACLGGGRIRANDTAVARPGARPRRTCNRTGQAERDWPADAAAGSGHDRAPGRRGWKRARRQDDTMALAEATPRLAENRRSITR